MWLLNHVLGNHPNLTGNNYKFTCRLNFLLISLMPLISEYHLPPFECQAFQTLRKTHSYGQMLFYLLV